MKLGKYIRLFMVLVLLFLVVPPLTAYCETPGECDVCSDAGLEGAAWGLCHAFCEATDCDLLYDGNPATQPKASQEACERLLAKFREKTTPETFPPCVVLDTDGDGYPDDIDNCPAIANPTQDDGDADGIGDVCDNCITVPNPGQEDFLTEGGPGDACDCPCWDHELLEELFSAYGNPEWCADHEDWSSSQVGEAFMITLGSYTGWYRVQVYGGVLMSGGDYWDRITIYREGLELCNMFPGGDADPDNPLGPIDSAYGVACDNLMKYSSLYANCPQ